MPDATPPPNDGPLNNGMTVPKLPGTDTPFETIHVDTPVVACDGGDGALGHPRVWLRIVAHDIVCPYCSRCYVLSDGASADPGH
jgi:uncharacterized Zn-finger protein